MLDNSTTRTALRDAQGVVFSNRSTLITFGSNGFISFDLGRRVGLLRGDAALLLRIGFNQRTTNLTTVMLDGAREEMVAVLGVQNDSFRFDPKICQRKVIDARLTFVDFQDIVIPLNGFDWHCTWSELYLSGSNNTLFVSNATWLRNGKLKAASNAVRNKTESAPEDNSLAPTPAAPGPSNSTEEDDERGNDGKNSSSSVRQTSSSEDSGPR